MTINKGNFNNLILDLKKGQVLNLIKSILSYDTISKVALVDELVITTNVGSKEIDFIINFLAGFKKIKVENDIITVLKKSNPKELFVSFSKHYFNLIINEEELNQHLFVDSEVTLINDFFKIKTSSIKLKYRQILVTLGKLELLEYEDDYVKIINYTFAKKFIERALKKLSKSQKEFEKELYEKKIRGELAEKFVMEFERDKLKEYSFFPIRQSVDDVGLGYDILSYDSDGKEMFIEVKSIKNNSFFWSENEIATSKEFKDDYFIYLVLFENNKPIKIKQIIQNPYNQIFNKNLFERKNIEDYIIYL
ncbi:DUF3883 domain-containing protein [Flavobacteriaceae bacterium]|jgi:hypothetical protein|nr:DUF3883 domain-containing protein [Flavobacteriaceae bacterium]